MQQKTTTPIDYAALGDRKARASVWGIGAFVTSLLLSPLTVIGGLVANDTIRDFMGGPISLFTIVALMALALLVPLVVLVLLCAHRRSGWGWALSGLIVSVVGWGGTVLIVATFVGPMRN